MTKKTLLSMSVVLGLVFASPLFVFAQGNVSNTLLNILGLINTVITILIVVAVGFFIFGIVKYMISSDKEEGKKIIFNGLIGLFVLVAFWGIIRIVQNQFGLGGANVLQQESIPCIQGINC